jgi:pseudaminic acid synthase
MNPKQVVIDGRMIGAATRPYVIAEMSGNHNGDIKRALALLEAAKNAGADAVKIQTYTPETMTIDHDGSDFQVKGGLWNGHSLYSLYQLAHTPWDWHAQLFQRARELGITLFSTPFDNTSVDFLEELGAPAYKIASFECTDLPLIRRVAATGKPLIISTGMATLGEIAETVDAARETGARDLILLHCVSGYPSLADEANLRTLPNLAETFNLIAGLSDHTMGVAVPLAAVALGAAVIEKHFTLARADGGPDAAFSLEPAELNQLVIGCQTVWDALGHVTYDVAESETSSLVFRRSLYIVEDIAAGELFTERNVRSIRPGYGMAPKYLPEILGRRASKSLRRGAPLSRSAVDWLESD